MAVGYGIAGGRPASGALEDGEEVVSRRRKRRGGAVHSCHKEKEGEGVVHSPGIGVLLSQ
jgi:hypothetical protein